MRGLGWKSYASENQAETTPETQLVIAEHRDSRV